MTRPSWLTGPSCAALVIAFAAIGCGNSQLGSSGTGGGGGAGGRGGTQAAAGGSGGTTGTGGDPAGGRGGSGGQAPGGATGTGGSDAQARCYGGAPCAPNETCEGACDANGSRIECFCQSGGFLCGVRACSGPDAGMAVPPICPGVAQIALGSCDPQVDTVCHAGWCHYVTGKDETCVCVPSSTPSPGTGGAGGAAGAAGAGGATAGGGYRWACGSYFCPSGAGGGGAPNPVLSPPACRAGIIPDSPCDWRTDGVCETACSATTHTNQDCVCATIVANNTFWKCAAPKSCVP